MVNKQKQIIYKQESFQSKYLIPEQFLFAFYSFDQGWHGLITV